MNANIVRCMLVVVVAALVATMACGRDEPKEIPTAVRAEKFYRFIAEDYASNPTRVVERISGSEIFALILTITNIEGAKVQQHIAVQEAGFDSYVECEFADKRMVLNLNRGEPVGVYGFLSEAFERRFRPDNKAVKLQDCNFLPPATASGT